MEVFLGNVKFKAKILKKVYRSEDFAIYNFIPISSSYDLYTNKYNEYTLKGELHELMYDLEYNFEAIYLEGKYGAEYKVITVYADTPKSLASQERFLKSILTERQAKSILNVYPNFVDMVVNGQQIDHDKIKFVGEKTLENISDKVIENFLAFDLIEEFGHFGFSNIMIKKLYKLYPDVELLKINLREKPYEILTKLDHVGFKKADQMILKMNPKLKESEQRITACIDYMLTMNEINGNTYESLRDLYSKVFDCIQTNAINFAKCIENGKKLNKYWLDDRMSMISKFQTYLTERYIARTLISMKYNNINHFQIDLEKYRTLEGFDLSDMQLKFLDNFCAHQFSLLEGFAGTGKSSSTKSLINLIEDLGLSYLILAPTGRASKVISQYTNRRASTIHRALRYNPQDGFTKNEYDKLEYDVVIIDEASMQDIWLFKALLKAIDHNKTRLLLIQDPEQIPSVSAGNISYDLLQSKLFPTTSLINVFRYGEGGISTVCTDVRNGKFFLSKNTTDVMAFGKNKDYIYANCDSESYLAVIETIYKNMLESNIKPEDILILSAQKNDAYGTFSINSMIQNIIHKNKTDEIFSIHHNLDQYTTLRVGDIVIQTKNNYKAKKISGGTVQIFNGDFGKVIEIDKVNKEVIIKFDDNSIIYNQTDCKNILLGYCITIHKSQGSSAKNVILVNPPTHKFLLNRNLMYVGLTRATDRVYHLTSPSTIRSCLRKSENRNRKTLLKPLLLMEEEVYKKEMGGINQ